MKVIQKKISLEQFKSRMPSIIPAYDENGKQHNFVHFTDLLNEPIINYNMLPFDVQVDEDMELGKYSGKLYSYSTLVNIFHNLDKNFNNPLTNECQETFSLESSDEKFYNWLLDKCFPYFIFDVELKNENLNIKDIKRYWGVNRLSVKEVTIWNKKMLDLSNNQLTDCCIQIEYEKRGGDIVLEKLQNWYNSKLNKLICTHQDYGHDFIYKIQDSDKEVTVKVLKNGIVTTHSFEIFEPRVRIFGNNRYIKYGRLDINNNVINPQIIEIINGILTIPCLFTSLDSPLVVSEPYFTLPLLLTNQQENIGEMTSICEEWDRGYEYNQNIDNKEEINYNNGALVYYNGHNWILKSYEYPGYIYSKTYQEIYFANEEGMGDDEYDNYKDEKNEFKYNAEQWTKYLDYLPNINTLTLNQYAYKGQQLVLTPNPLVMGDKYIIEINNNQGYCLYNDKLYPVHFCDSITYKNKFYEVFYTYQYLDNKRNPYVYIDGKKIFINKSTCPPNNKHNYTINVNGMYIQYGNELIPCSSQNLYDGFITYNSETILFKKIKQSNITTFSAVTKNIGEYVENKEQLSKKNNEFKGYCTVNENNNWYVIISSPYITYDGNFVSGETTSKLNDLVSNIKLATDNLGNTLKGLMPYKEYEGIDVNGNTKKFFTYVVNPLPDDWLSIPYIPKHVNNLSVIESEKDIYWGDIIDQIVIEYDVEVIHQSNDKTIENNHKVNDVITVFEKNIIETYKDPHSNNFIDETKYHFTHKCSTIEELRVLESKLMNYYMEISNIICYVEYYKGTIIQKENNNFKLKLNDDNVYYGVKYIDTLSLTKKQCQYYYDEIDTCILNYWEMREKINIYNNDTYNVRNLSEPTSSFEFKTQPFELQYGYKLYNDNEKFTFYKVNELSESIIYNGVEYTVDIQGSKKTFSIPLVKGVEKLIKHYNYYCIVNNERVYATYNDKRNLFEIIIGDIVYISQNLINIWVDEDTVNGILSNIIYCEIPLQLFLITPQNTSDTYFDYKNDMDISPLIFDEKKLGLASQEKISGDIYIDRGTVRAMDYHLRLLEAKSLESLEQIGNGFFKFNSNNEIK